MGQYNSRLSGKTDDFDLLRIRPYVDFWYQDIFRIYAEMIFATSTPQSQTPLKTDVDAIDFLNLFIGVKLCEIDDHGVFLRLAGRNSWSAGATGHAVRVGRHRQTFQGVHLLVQWHLDFDGWWTQPVAPNPDGWSWIDRRCSSGPRFQLALQHAANICSSTGCGSTTTTP